MSMIVRFTPTGLTAQKYDESVKRIKESGEWPPDGLDYHVCFGSEGKLRVTEIWDSQDKFQVFGERLMPILNEVGIEPGEPEVFEIHKIEKR